jgi:hypothetical protein
MSRKTVPEGYVEVEVPAEKDAAERLDVMVPVGV